MDILTRYLTGLVAIHFVWLLFYATGSLLRPAHVLRDDAEALADLVITTVGGMALLGFAIFLVGIFGLLDARGLILIAIGAIAAAYLLGRQRGSWRERFGARVQNVKRACSLANCILYAVLLALALACILPYGDFDVGAFYLPYALDWSNAGRIFVDESLWLPYYANNFLTLYAAMFKAGLGGNINFLTWLCGALSALGIFAAVRVLPRSPEDDRRAARFALGAAIAVTASTIFLPSFLRWVDGGMLDVPLGLFLFVPVLAAALTIKSGRERSYLREIVLISGFCIGMKPAFLALAPLFISIWFASASALRTAPRAIAAGIAAIAVLASPWYVWNIIADGDPYPPLLHLALHKEDRIISNADFSVLRGQTATAETPLDILKIPLRFFTDAGAPDFVEYGANISVVFLYVPFLAAGYILVMRRRSGMAPHLTFLVLACVYALCYWIVSSHHARFFLEVSPVVAATLGSLAVWSTRGRGLPVRSVMLGVLVAGVIPSPSAWNYMEYLYQSHFASISEFLPASELYQQQLCDGCQEVDYLARHLGTNRGHRVFGYDLAELTYMLRARGLDNIGIRLSAFPERTFVAAVERNDLSGYVQKYSVDAFLINTNRSWPDASHASFLRQIQALGFRPWQRKYGTIVVYLKAE